MGVAWLLFRLVAERVGELLEEAAALEPSNERHRRPGQCRPPGLNRPVRRCRRGDGAAVALWTLQEPGRRERACSMCRRSQTRLGSLCRSWPAPRNGLSHPLAL